MSRYKTPLRYPGGKQRLAPFIREVMAGNGLLGGNYIEPYAGGAGVAMELLLGGDVSTIHLNDASPAIHAFWWSILEETEEFCRRIAAASLTVDEWRRQKAILAATDGVGMVDLGFSLFFLNRCNRSGIPSGGVIGGLDQSGPWKIDARFSRVDLIARVEAIAFHRKKIRVTNLDAEDFIRRELPRMPAKSLVYLDPPYFNKAERLYLNHYTPDDHARLARVIQREIRIPWVVSYDNAPEILQHYATRQFFLYDLQYNAAKTYKGREAFFFSDKVRIPRESEIKAINDVLQGIGA
jgi:DNA adenine methylase